ncbi:MAG: bifunctional hydroxymethylpyrimidine kinase/phosphomethylpyrimidine kinase [Actinobacteria bacterium]|nr:bifunctional hydroxymethylpyrimidine kinase/phosphomethylpyrimidine kinase [Actinomycetota bacterium]
MRVKLPVALTIAGSDSGGGAGIQADIKTFFACGVHGTCAVTSVTSQNTVGVMSRCDLAAEVVVSQVEAVMSDFDVAGVKTGMLASAAIIEAVAELLAARRGARLVVDPVAVSTSGHSLLDGGGIETIAERLFPLAEVITPNLAETALLLDRQIGDVEGMKKAAMLLKDMGPACVLVKGGHMEASSAAVDIFYDGSDLVTLTAPLVDTENTHGTGCTLSAAIAAYLARGEDPLRATGKAKRIVTGALQNALEIGGGRGPVHPLAAGGGIIAD